MSKFTASQVRPTSLIVVIDGKDYPVDNSHPNWLRLRQAVKDKDVVTFLSCVDIPKAVNLAVKNTALVGKVEVRDNEVWFNGEILHNSLTRRMLDMLREGFDIQPLVLFLENLMKNPSKRAVDELFDFLDHKNLPLTEDGHFLGYKAVRKDFLDKFSGTIDNSIGKTVEIARNAVDDDRQHECSHGLHVGCLEYSGPTGWYHSSNDRVLIVKVNPADCVAVPKDHNATKLRVCKYVVVDEFKGALNKAVYSGAKVGDDNYVNDEYTFDDSAEETYSDEIDVNDIEEGDDIRFDYTKVDGTKHRYGHVESVSWLNSTVTCLMNLPDEDAGHYRTFSFDKMSDVQLD